MLELVYDVFGNFTNASLEQAKTKSSSSEYTFETPINSQVLGSGICKGKFWVSLSPEYSMIILLVAYMHSFR